MICFNCNRLNINIISAIFAFFIVILTTMNFKYCSLSLDIVPVNNYNQNNNVEAIYESIVINNKEKQDTNLIQEWRIEIPRIELNANIAEGTTEEILDDYVGHFEENSKFDGNVGLAAHNRGYNVNYFEKIKELETGDEIIYKYDGNIRKYIVKTRQIIKETDWSYLENTEDNRITLITCVEDMPEYRRCIQAIEKKEE